MKFIYYIKTSQEKETLEKIWKHEAQKIKESKEEKLSLLSYQKEGAKR